MHSCEDERKSRSDNSVFNIISEYIEHDRPGKRGPE